ncbi:hypothetical protein R1sor_017743 [Riccia sorocarpa]|uniref:Endonuclease/exonuclease/phosphatase domain-containing protein n=1 Tax=Riccia sorocarpa TaxID=122646 RepID=A0ABD3I8U7_9MARC
MGNAYRRRGQQTTTGRNTQRLQGSQNTPSLLKPRGESSAGDGGGETRGEGSENFMSVSEGQERQLREKSIDNPEDQHQGHLLNGGARLDAANIVPATVHGGLNSVTTKNTPPAVVQLSEESSSSHSTGTAQDDSRTPIHYQETRRILDGQTTPIPQFAGETLPRTGQHQQETLQSTQDWFTFAANRPDGTHGEIQQSTRREIFIASVYAPNDAEDRMGFFGRLRDCLPPGSWILAGDWNSTEFRSDSSSGSNLLTNDEAVEFQLLCSSLDLTDARPSALKRKGP